MSSTNVPSSKKSSTTNSPQHSERAVAVPSSTKPEKQTFEPLPLDEQIVLVSILKAYQDEFVSPDVHQMAYALGAQRAIKMGVPMEKARDIVLKLTKHYKNPFPGFF